MAKHGMEKYDDVTIGMRLSDTGRFVPRSIVGALITLTLAAVTSSASILFADDPKPNWNVTTNRCGPPANADIDHLDRAQQRAIGAGQSHWYAVAVGANEFLRLVVDQRGIDLAVQICRQDGRQVTAVDRPNGSYGPEAISVASDQAGTLLVEIRSARSVVAATYEIRILERRPVQSNDVERLEAEKAISAGEVERADGRPASLVRAIQKFDGARTCWHDLRETYEEALALYGMGWSYSELGSYGMVKFPIPEQRLRWSYESRADHEKAIDCFRQALPLMRELGDLYGQAIIQAGLAWPELYLGLNDQALENFQGAYRFFEQTNNVRGQAIALYGTGWIYAVQGDDQKALDVFREALLLRQSSRDRKGEAITLAAIGKAESHLGAGSAAIDYVNRALTIFTELQDVHGQASTYSILGWINYGLNNNQPAADSFNQSLVLARETQDITGQANSLYGMARVHDRQGDLLEASHCMKEVVDLVTPLRERGADAELRTFYFANVQEYYEFYVDLLMRLGRLTGNAEFVADAMAAHERARARELLAILAEASERTLQSGDVSHPLSVEEIQRLLDPNTLLLEYGLGERASYLWLVSQNSVQGYELLPRSQIEASVTWAYQELTARNKIESAETATQRRIRIAHSDLEYEKAAAQLSRMILGPVADELASQRLVVISEGALQMVPFGALPLPSAGATGKPLIISHEIINLPSASTLQVLRQQLTARIPARHALAVFADPVFSADDLRVLTRRTDRLTLLESPPPSRFENTSGLPGQSRAATSSEPRPAVRRLLGTRWEGQQIAALIPPQERLLALDFAASRSRAMSSELGEYRKIHFATHAIMSDNDPASSMIVLSQVDEQGRAQNGSLRLRDIAELKLKADLVVLSACRTGLGDDRKGEGIRGFAGEFMHAGVPRIVVSLWPVDDKFTADFMVRFYRSMLTGSPRTPAAALRQVQTQLIADKRWPSPYFWAAFVIQGEWR